MVAFVTPRYNEGDGSLSYFLVGFYRGYYRISRRVPWTMWASTVAPIAYIRETITDVHAQLIVAEQQGGHDDD